MSIGCADAVNLENGILLQVEKQRADRAYRDNLVALLKKNRQEILKKLLYNNEFFFFSFLFLLNVRVLRLHYLFFRYAATGVCLRVTCVSANEK